MASSSGSSRIPSGEVELGLDVGLLRPGPRYAASPGAPEEEPDRLRQDRLAGAGLARDRVQARREGEVGLADEDEALDAEAAEHGLGPLGEDLVVAGEEGHLGQHGQPAVVRADDAP